MPREKRPAASDGQEEGKRHVRKRERYTRVACETCKARKVKCSGTRPCGRCAELTVECKYHEHFPAEPIVDLKAGRGGEVSQKDLGQLLSTMKELCEEIELKTNRRTATSPSSGFLLQRRGSTNNDDALFMNTPVCPTNFVRSLNLAQKVLQENGIIPTANTVRAAGQQLPHAHETQPAERAKVTLEAARPLLELGHDRVMQYFTTFEHEVYPAYPCINLEYAREKTGALFTKPSPTSDETVQDRDVELIDVELSKAVMAIAMLVSDECARPLSSDLESHLIWNIDNNIKQETAQPEDVIMSTLLGIYFVLKDEAVKAWRIVGFAAKTCLELGMHKAWLHSASDESLANAKTLKTLFCCVYDLDKRCSFFTGLPWTLDDREIDESVLELNGRHPFLSAMNDLTRVHVELAGLSKASPPVESDSKEKTERLEFLDFRVQKLAESFPKDEIPLPASSGPDLATSKEVLEGIYQLRANQIRMFPHIRSLSSAAALNQRLQSAQMLVSLAISSVDLHERIFTASGARGVSHLWRSLMDLLLMGSVSCMFLAASYKPAEYGPACHEAFHRGIDMLQQSPHQSKTVRQRMWCSLDDLRRIGESIQLHSPDRTPPAFCSTSGSSASAELLGLHDRHADDDIFASYETLNHDFLTDFGSLDPNWHGQLEELGFNIHQ